MTDTCPCCGQPIPETDLVAWLMDLCRDSGIEPLAGGFIYEADAERLLGYCRGTLRRQVYDKRDVIPFVRRGNRRLYALSDILESGKISHSTSHAASRQSEF